MYCLADFCGKNIIRTGNLIFVHKNYSSKAIDESNIYSGISISRYHIVS